MAMLSTVFALTILAGPEEPASAGQNVERERQEAVSRLVPAEARRIALLCASEEDRTPQEAADLHHEPLLRWSNPTAGSVYGEVFLWTLNERPAAIASIYRWYHPFRDSTVELVSLSEGKLAATEDEAPRWNTGAGGIAYNPLADAPAPGKTPQARLAQMRAISRRFQARLEDKRGGDEVARELRLLNQPAYRYTCPEAKIADGALFAFVEGTDPEAWLLLEAKEAEGRLAWRFALARMNRDPLTVLLDEAPVQTWPGLGDTWSDRTRPYVTFNFDPERAEPPAKRTNESQPE